MHSNRDPAPLKINKYFFFNQPTCYCCVCLVANSHPTLCNPMDHSLPGPSVFGISQAGILEWIAISFSMGSYWSRDRTHVSCTGWQILHHWATREALPAVGGGIENPTSHSETRKVGVRENHLQTTDRKDYKPRILYPAKTLFSFSSEWRILENRWGWKICILLKLP